MKILINTPDQLNQAYLDYKVKLASKVQKLIVAIMNKACRNDIESVDLAVNKDLLPASYTTVPAMLARTLSPNLEYLHVQCRLIGDTITIHCANVKHPSSFRARLIHGLLEKKRFVAPKHTVPSTYRTRPRMLTRSIRNEIEGKIATIAKSNRIIWKLKR